jgi:hypothetical protein
MTRRIQIFIVIVGATSIQSSGIIVGGYDIPPFHTSHLVVQFIAEKLREKEKSPFKKRWCNTEQAIHDTLHRYNRFVVSCYFVVQNPATPL